MNQSFWDDNIFGQIGGAMKHKELAFLMNENDSDRKSYFDIGVEGREKSSYGCGDTLMCLNLRNSHKDLYFYFEWL